MVVSLKNLYIMLLYELSRFCFKSLVFDVSRSGLLVCCLFRVVDFARCDNQWLKANGIYEQREGKCVGHIRNVPDFN